MYSLLAQTLSRLNRIRRLSHVGTVAIRVLRATWMAGAMLGLWTYLKPDDRYGQLFLTLLTFIVGMSFNSKRRPRQIQEKDLLLSLEMEHPETKHAPFRLKEQPLPFSIEEEWTPILDNEVKKFATFEQKRLMRMLSTLPLPLILFLAGTHTTTAAIKTAFNNVSQVVAQLTQGATLTVLEGAGKEEQQKAQKLSSSRPLELELMSENLVEIKVVGLANMVPTVNLKRELPAKDGEKGAVETFQSFQLSPVRDATTDEGTGIYSIQFAITEDAQIFLSTMSDRAPAAIVKVKQLPVPRVRLAIDGEKKEPWPDDKPLPLLIDVKAENPLAQVRLRIKAGQRTMTELVNNIMTDDLKELSTNYNVILESYVENDQAEVEIVAEAIDRSLPQPLIGFSAPLVIQTVSAYGRYRQALQTLREVKELMDEVVKTNKMKDFPKIKELTEKAVQQSEDSPFFDGVDRLNLTRFGIEVAELEQEFAADKLLELSKNINDFLFEHEVINDRERDRDFFVAVRALSRVLEKSRDKRTVTVAQVTKRIKTFLDERHQRWDTRVKHLGPGNAPKLWARVSQKPFHQSMDTVNRLDGEELQSSNQKALVELSTTVSTYREWIEELEAVEDKVRKQQEEKRQQGLANAQNQLRELQKRQGQISNKLDRANGRSKEDLENIWPPVRMDQNTNIEEASQMEAQLRALSPQAGQRLKAAVEAMRFTVNAGGTGDFVQAESGADLAGRLLRQAESAASRAQQQQQKRGRRRRVTGDSYFGSQVAGGDIEIRREYEVSRKYREDILDDVRSRGGDRDPAEEQLLENYLRKVIR